MRSAEIQRFREQGFVCVPRFFDSREVAALRAEVERWREEGALRNVATAGDGRTHSRTSQNLQLVPLHDKSDLYRALAFHPRVVAAVSALLGDPVMKILDQLFHKPARHGSGTSWHTDNGYFRLEDPLRGTALWIALDDATRENGTLKVIPGRFREDWSHERDPQSDHHIRTYPDEAEAVHCELDAGGVVFFCFGTPHATGPNPTASPRTGIGLHFVNRDHAPAAMTSARRLQHVLLTGPDASGGVAEYGVRLAGRFADEVERVLAAAES